MFRGQGSVLPMSLTLAETGTFHVRWPDWCVLAGGECRGCICLQPSQPNGPANSGGVRAARAAVQSLQSDDECPRAPKLLPQRASSFFNACFFASLLCILSSVRFSIPRSIPPSRPLLFSALLYPPSGQADQHNAHTSASPQDSPASLSRRRKTGARLPPRHPARHGGHIHIRPPHCPVGE